jgi:hypothetical protein
MNLRKNFNDINDEVLLIANGKFLTPWGGKKMYFRRYLAD